MPRRRRGNYNRNDRQGDQPETSGPQGNQPPAGNPSQNPPAAENTSPNPPGADNRPQQRRSGQRRGFFPRELTPAEVNERLKQRQQSRQGNEPGNSSPNATPKDRPTNQNQGNRPQRRRTDQPGQPDVPGDTPSRRNPANRNARGNNPRGNNPRGGNSGSSTSSGSNAGGNNAGDNNAGGRIIERGNPNKGKQQIRGRNFRGPRPAGGDAATQGVPGTRVRPTGTRGSGARTPGGKPGSAPRRGFSVQRSSYSERAAPSVPIRTNKGIKARDQRGQSSQHWWARRWIEAMEGLVDQARLLRGRSYAHSGQVLSIIETQNGIEAKVQGSRPKPYEVTIQVTPLNDRQWDLVIDAMSEQALFTAQLLAGEMPSNIEDAFNTAGVSLFPSTTGDLSSDCTCPDWANPCKHVAATHYILGDRFDDDPFLLFRMRGRTQEEILEGLRMRRADTGDGTVEAVEEETLVETEKIAPLEDLMERFWDPVESLDKLPLTIKLASVDLPLLKRMGEPAFMGGESLQALLKPFYDTFTRSALRAAYSEDEPVESSNGSDSEEQEL